MKFAIKRVDILKEEKRMKEVVIVSAVRTPVGNFGGALNT
jgi:hypothetical protein